jgi:hypothetical protein
VQETAQGRSEEKGDSGEFDLDSRSASEAAIRERGSYPRYRTAPNGPGRSTPPSHSAMTRSVERSTRSPCGCVAAQGSATRRERAERKREVMTSMPADRRGESSRSHGAWPAGCVSALADVVRATKTRRDVPAVARLGWPQAIIRVDRLASS